MSSPTMHHSKSQFFVVSLLVITAVYVGSVEPAHADEPPTIERGMRVAGGLGWMALRHRSGRMDDMGLSGPTAGLRASYRFLPKLELTFDFAAGHTAPSLSGLVSSDDWARFYEVGGTLDLLLVREPLELGVGLGGTAWQVSGQTSSWSGTAAFEDSGPAFLARIAARFPLAARISTGAEATMLAGPRMSGLSLFFTVNLSL